MKISFTQHTFDGERVVTTSPELSNRVSSDWYSRPTLYTGRALTADTLISSTRHRLRHMQLFGRQLSRGVIQGLTLSAFTRTSPDNEGGTVSEQWLRLTAGLGVTVYGDDVTLPETADILLDHVAVWNSESPPRGAGIFVLQPLEILDEIVGDGTSQCPWDETTDPFDDEQIVDGCRLVFYPWPEGLLGPLPRVQARQFRNQMAYRIFDYEKDHPDVPFPWEHVGVPLGLAYIAVTSGNILFVDRAAAVRQGGAPLAVKTLLTFNGTPFLWESRIQQFIGHITDIRQTAEEIPNAFTYFDVLPPVGVLPRQALDTDTMSTTFFPSQFIIDASPIPEEQLEVAMNASAGLAPFDLYQPEKIKLLVPVPQSVYQPDLLKKEEPDPVFLETLRKLIREIRQVLVNRNYLRSMADRVVGAVDAEQIPVYVVDQNTIPDEATFPVTLVRHEGLTEYGLTATDTVKALHDWIRQYASGVAVSVTDPLKPTAQTPPRFRPEFRGIENFIRDLQALIKKTEALLNSCYLRAESDMFRLRQLLLGNVKASRLATSPALGQIVSGKTRQPSITDVETYFKEAADTKADDDIQTDLDRVTDLSGKTEQEKLTQAYTIMKKMESGESLSTRDIYEATQVMTSAFSKRVGGDSKAIAMVARPTKVSFDSGDTYTFKDSARSTITKYRDSVEISKALGLERDKTIVERVYESPSQEVKSNAVKTKTSIFDALADVPLDIDDEVTVVGSDKALLKLDDYNAILEKLEDTALKTIIANRSATSGKWVVISTIPLTDKESAPLSAEQKTRISRILNSLRSKRGISVNDIRDLKDSDDALGRNIREGIFDPDPDDGDEADYFTAGVTALEHGLNAMRIIEKRLDDYKKAVTRSQAVLTTLRTNAGRWNDALAEIGSSLQVLRHDALVTRSLFEEEKARLAAINAERKGVLDTYVKTLVFVRPRLVDPRLDVTSVPLYPEYVNPVPACLAEDYQATGELADMIDVFREVPLRWLTDARGLVKLMDTPSAVAGMIAQAGERAVKTVVSASSSMTTATPSYASSDYGKAVSAIVSASADVKKTLAKQRKEALNVTGLSSKTWLELVDHAENNVSLADLIEKGKGYAKLASKASEVMENLEDVAVCLNHLCDGLAPAVKLRWATLISIYDTPVDLRHLDALPGFDTLDYTLRRDLQNMVDWLFSQVDTSIDKARQTINDLVRVCILLAAHAPVSTIINGYVPAPSIGRIGDFLDITISKGQIRAGMIATVITGQSVVVQGVVADITDHGARIQVTHGTGGASEYSISQGAQVKFATGTAGRVLK